MDVNEEMNRAVDALLGEMGAPNVSEVTRRMLRVAWLDGYKRGMEAVDREAQAAFSRLAERLQA